MRSSFLRSRPGQAQMRISTACRPSTVPQCSSVNMTWIGRRVRPPTHELKHMNWNRFVTHSVPAASKHTTAQTPLPRLVTPPSIGERSIAMNVSVCLSVSVCVCLSVRDHISGTTRPVFNKFMCMLPMAVARSSSCGVVISNVLPVLG